MTTLTSRQTIGRHCNGSLGLSGSICMRESICACKVSPYFQMTDLREEAPGRDITISLLMDINVIVVELYIESGVPSPVIAVYDTSDNFINTFVLNTMTQSEVRTMGLNAAEVAAINAWAAANGYIVSNIYWNVASATNRTVTNPTRALNTAYQPSATLPTLVVASIEQDDSLSLTQGTKSNVQMLVSSNSSFTTSTTDSELVNGNTGTLTIGLNTVQAGGAPLIGYVPAGYYYKFVPTNTTGTATNTVLATTEIIGI